ncbi:MAG TPA: putative Ig domain-containing protein [Polyangiaceae bacterium]
MRQISTAASIQEMRVVPRLANRNPPSMGRSRVFGFANGCEITRVAWLAVFAFALGCDAPTVKLADCEAICRTGVCPDGLECRAGYCVHPSMTGFCNELESTGGQAGAATVESRGGDTSAAGSSQSPSGGGSNWGSAGSTGALTASSGVAGATTAGDTGSGGVAGSNTVVAGTAGVAETGGVAGIAGAGTAGTGGTGPIDGTSGGTGATPGGMGGCTAVGIPLQIDSEPDLPRFLCSDRHYSSILTVVGSAADYQWEGSPTLDGVKVDILSATTSSLDILAAPVGQFPSAVRVRSECGFGEYGFEVVAPPVVTTSSLATACLDELYNVQLKTLVAGADDEWHGDLPSDLGLTLTADGKLTGKLVKAGTYAFDVWVKNRRTDCASSRVRLALTVDGVESATCPRIVIKGRPAYVEAPDACDGWPYRAEISATGGIGPYTWTAVELPTGLVFDSTTQVVSGVVSSSASRLFPIDLRVTDGNGHVIQRSFAIARREKCWLSYLSDETGTRRLHLYDPQLGSRMRRPVSDSNDLSVADFKFSPDGRFLAYRVKDATDAYQLWLWQGPGWDHEQELNVGGSVTQYEWSSDGLVLAASAVDTAGGTWLGGCDVSAVPKVSPPGNIQGLLGLPPVSAAVQSELTWYGRNGYVAYLTSIGASRVFNHAKYSPTGFAEVYQDIRPYSAGFSLRASDFGFFAENAAGRTTDFFAIGRGDPVYHDNIAIAPDGNLVALAASDRLTVYLPTAISSPPADPSFATANGCSRVLAWAKQQSLVVCVDSTAQLMRVFAIHSDATISASTISNSAAMANEPWTMHRRALSSTGKWLAFAADTKLYLGDLGRTPPEIVRVSAFQAGQPEATFRYSPDERLLSIHRGKDIYVVELETDGMMVNLAPSASSAPPCQDEYLPGADFCGADSAAQPVWSADSNSLAFVLADGHLVVADLRQRPISVIRMQDVISTCGEGCLGTQRFQP